MAGPDEPSISKHSSGISIIIRIDGLWKEANIYSCSGQYSGWNTKLDVIWRELARDLTDVDYKLKKKDFDAFDALLVKAGEFKDTGSDSFAKASETDNKNRSKQYRILNDKELFLKRLENKLGKGTTFSDGDEDDF